MLQMITCDNHSSSYAWQNHVHGAAAFLGYLCSTNGLPVSPVKELIEICYTTVRWYAIREQLNYQILIFSRRLRVLSVAKWFRTSY